MRNIATEPLVSILIPTYKNSSTLSRAVDSCLQQTYASIEVIVVDDNNPRSKDRSVTEAVMKPYARDQRVRYVKHTKNRNGSAARNTGFKHSHGEYICLLDDDDYFDKEKITHQLAFLLKNPQYMAATTTVYKNGVPVDLKKKEDYTLEILRAEGSPPTPSLMIKREAYVTLGGFDESYVRHQDYEFLLRFFQTYKMGFSSEAITHVCSDGTDNRPKARDSESIKNKFLDQFEYIIVGHVDSTKTRKKAYSAKYAHLFYAYLKELKIFSAFRIFVHGLIAARSLFLRDVANYGIKYIRLKAS